MKAKELRPLCVFEERAPLFGDRLFYVPKNYDKHHLSDFPGWVNEKVFLNEAPIYIEYCSGNGSWIAAKARAEPHVNYVAVEVRFDRVRKIWAKAKNLFLNNLFTIWGEAFTFTHYYVPNSSVSKIFINFPDPWPKRRQEKHRLLTKEFIFEMARVLKPSGTIMFVTDEENYLQRTCRLFLESPHLTPSFPEPYVVTEFPNYGTSFFDTLWREKGKKIHYLQLERNETFLN